MAHLLWYLDPLFSPHQLKKKLSKLDPLDPRMNADQKSLETVFLTAIVCRVGVIKIVIAINCNLITFSKIIACNCN